MLLKVINLQMVSKTEHYFGPVTSFYGSHFYVFSRTTVRICVNFFSGFRRKH